MQRILQSVNEFFIMYMFFKDVFNYVKADLDKERLRRMSSICCFIPQMAAVMALGHSEARSQWFHLSLSCGCRGTCMYVCDSVNNFIRVLSVRKMQ